MCFIYVLVWQTPRRSILCTVLTRPRFLCMPVYRPTTTTELSLLDSTPLCWTVVWKIFAVVDPLDPDKQVRGWGPLAAGHPLCWMRFCVVILVSVAASALVRIVLIPS